MQWRRDRSMKKPPPYKPSLDVQMRGTRFAEAVDTLGIQEAPLIIQPADRLQILLSGVSRLCGVAAGCMVVMSAGTLTRGQAIRFIADRILDMAGVVERRQAEEDAKAAREKRAAGERDER